MNRQSISAGDQTINLLAGRDVNLTIGGNVPTEIIDQKIKEEVEKLRKSRFFSGFDSIEASLILGRHLVKGNLSGGSDKVRAHGLNWSARLLSPSKGVRACGRISRSRKEPWKFSRNQNCRIIYSFPEGGQIERTSYPCRYKFEQISLCWFDDCSPS